ncbi:MAG: TIGR04283 family arsenosugar biosynthesis glycosyltransferase [Cyanobacteria bacterium J06581_3]
MGLDDSASVSIIIPTLNEAKNLARSLRCLTILDPPAKEIILVDGGSCDGTVAIAQSFKTTLHISVVHSPIAKRSVQMNLGAQQANGDILCFLHGDTTVPDDAIAIITKTLNNPVTSCGGFISIMRGETTTRWLTSLHNSLKTYYAPLLFRPWQFFRYGLRILFGDQVMFCRRQDFLNCGGFDPTLEIMEEADLCFKLSRKGKIKQVNRVVQSSDRRVAAWGVWKANFIYLAIGALWSVGVSDKTLKRFYEDIR